MIDAHKSQESAWLVTKAPPVLTRPEGRGAGRPFSLDPAADEKAGATAVAAHMPLGALPGTAPDADPNPGKEADGVSGKKKVTQSEGEASGVIAPFAVWDPFPVTPGGISLDFRELESDPGASGVRIGTTASHPAPSDVKDGVPVPGLSAPSSPAAHAVSNDVGLIVRDAGARRRDVAPSDARDVAAAQMQTPEATRMYDTATVQAPEGQNPPRDKAMTTGPVEDGKGAGREIRRGPALPQLPLSGNANTTEEALPERETRAIPAEKANNAREILFKHPETGGNVKNNTDTGPALQFEGGARTESVAKSIVSLRWMSPAPMDSSSEHNDTRTDSSPQESVTIPAESASIQVAAPDGGIQRGQSDPGKGISLVANRDPTKFSTAASDRGAADQPSPADPRAAADSSGPDVHERRAARSGKGREIGATPPAKMEDGQNPEGVLGGPVATETISAVRTDSGSAAPVPISPATATDPAAVSGVAHRWGGQPQFSSQVPAPPEAQLASHARRATGGAVELTLSPEELGRVRMTLDRTDTSMIVTIHAERGDTLDLLRRNSVHLAQDFRAMGFDQTTFSFGSWSQDRQLPAQPARIDDLAAPSAETASLLTPPPAPKSLSRGSYDGLDLRL